MAPIVESNIFEKSIQISENMAIFAFLLFSYAYEHDLLIIVFLHEYHMDM